MNKGNQKGITLIALIITIIVMLILVAVAVRTAINSGLFGHASDATKRWGDAQEKEGNIGNGKVIIDGKEYNSIDEYIENNNKNEEPIPPEIIILNREDLYGIMKGNFVKVHCINSKHEDKNFSTWTGTVEGNHESSIGDIYKTGDDYYVDITLNGAVYLAMYACDPTFGVGVLHSLAEDESQYKTITLKWNKTNKKWESITALPINFDVKCE